MINFNAPVGKLVGDGLTQFHLELDAVVKADEIVACADYPGADTQQRKYLVEAELFQAALQLQFFCFVFLEVVALVGVDFEVEGDAFGGEGTALPQLDLTDCAEGSRPQLLHIEIVRARIRLSEQVEY